MRFCNFSCLPRVNSVEQHILKELWYTAYFSGDLFEILFFQFNFLREYFFNGFLNSLYLLLILWLPVWEVKLRYIRLFR